jgi:L-iditol 2-dehydrogenase
MIKKTPDTAGMVVRRGGLIIALPMSLLHRIPDNIPFEGAALAEPLAVVVHAVSDRCGIETNDIVVVFGPGTIGLPETQVAGAGWSKRKII